MKATALALLLMAAAPVAAATEIAVSYSPEFTEKLQDDYGMKEGEVLAGRIERDLTRQLARAGVDVAKIDVTILDARPSRPTFKQAGDKPGLDMMRSVSVGGMKLKAVAFDASGAPAGELEYDWYENDIRNAGLTTWHDAGRASDRFARKFAKALD
ncbi:MAG: hypothetical protein CVT79_16655 [Alphaproteobacteria bacterium HGW-Alphaproteobacteria-18]|nr:MAG: hypothetical protein CVT79_16655 [Alphaproteobacteria bacterium HGW-Alphaproteobacteria-18]